MEKYENNRIENKENAVTNKDILYDYNDFYYKEKVNIDEIHNKNIPKEFYKLAFYNVYQRIKQDKKLAKKIPEIHNNYEKKVFELQTRESEVFNEIVYFSKKIFLEEMVIMIEKILNKQKISYKEENFVSFYRSENNQQVLYYFTWSLHEDVLNVMEEKEKRYQLQSLNKFNKIKIVALAETGVRQDNTLKNLFENGDRYYEKKYDIEIKRGTLRAFFNQFFDETEYETFYKELKEFNKRVNKMIGYATVTLPSSGEMLQEFKNRCKDELKIYKLDNKNINAKQRDLIIRNYLDNDNYLYILGSNDFSESFLSSEWYYKQYDAIDMDMIEQTAIIVGYLKSIEQLLYQINLLSLDKGLEIHNKDHKRVGFTTENKDKDEFDTTLGSLINCLEFNKNKEAWKVEEYIQDFIIEELNSFKNNYRNDHLHKDNVYDRKTIEEIRNKTLELYCLLLGSLNLKGNKFDKFGELKEKNSINIETTKKRFDEWLDMLIIGNSDIELGKTLQFWIHSNKIELNIWPDNVDENSEAVGDTVLTSLGCDFECNFDASDEGLILIETWVKEYLNTGKGKDILNNYNTIFLQSTKRGRNKPQMILATRMIKNNT